MEDRRWSSPRFPPNCGLSLIIRRPDRDPAGRLLVVATDQAAGRISVYEGSECWRRRNERHLRHAGRILGIQDQPTRSSFAIQGKGGQAEACAQLCC